MLSLKDVVKAPVTGSWVVEVLYSDDVLSVRR